MTYLIYLKKNFRYNQLNQFNLELNKKNKTASQRKGKPVKFIRRIEDIFKQILQLTVRQN